MSIQTPIQLKGVPGSPFTRKMLAYLRYRNIPYQFLIWDQADKLGYPKPKVELMPTFYLPNDAGELEAVVDTTPLIRRFEEGIQGRYAVSQNPVLAFLNYLIEDYADEWLNKPMFHYRWSYDDDIDMAGKLMMSSINLQGSDEQLQQLQQMFSQRQISRLPVVGSNKITAPIIEKSYQRFLSIMDKLIQQQPFVLGERPSSADFAIYAQLSQLAKFDPTPSTICISKTPRVYAWTDRMDDLSGQPADDVDWMALDNVQQVLGDLLVEIGRGYAPALLANAKALQAGEEQWETTIGGQPWVQPTFPYQAKCLQWLNAEYQALASHDRQTVDQIIAGTGCEALILA